MSSPSTAASPAGISSPAPYSIADMAIWPWAWGWERQNQDIAEFPHMKAWLDRMWERPAVKTGRALGAEKRRDLATDKKGASDPVRPARAVTHGWLLP